MTREEIQQEILEIERIRAEFEQRLAALKVEEDGIVRDFIKKLEEQKINEVRTLLTQQP